ncbi:MAG: hypothetical protein ACFFD4_18830 [Candidatus Odinarchaeota archaeon]
MTTVPHFLDKLGQARRPRDEGSGYRLPSILARENGTGQVTVLSGNEGVERPGLE